MKNEIRKVPLEELTPAPYNPRKISKQALKGLAASIKRFGLVQPIVVNKRTNLVVGGHQRLQALRMAGEATADVVYVDLNEKEEKALNLALNSPTVAGSYTDALQVILDDIRDAMPHDFIDLRFDELWTPAKIGSVSNEDDVPELPKKPISKRGDVWKLGGHILVCGDATNSPIAGAKADMMWTDPPYGVSYVGKTKEALTIEGDKSVSLGVLLERSFAIADQVLSDRSPIYVAHPAGPLAIEFATAFAKLWRVHETLVWQKNSIVMGHSAYHYQHEPILYGWKGKNRRWFGGRSQSSILEFDRPSRSSSHPTMKPVALIVRCLVNSSVKGARVYEPFCGSGSTLIACQQTERLCLGVEIDPRYCDVIIERWQNFTGLQAVKK